LLYGALGGGLFFLPFNLIQVQGYGPTAAGASLLPLVLLVSVMSPFAGSLSARVGPRVLLVAGPLVAAVGFALLALPGMPESGTTYWTTFFPAIVVLGFGLGLTVAPLTTAVMGAVDRSHAGVASGVNNAVSRAAGLLAVAVLGVVLQRRFDGSLDTHLAALQLSPALAADVAAERPKLGAATFEDVASPLRDALHEAFGRAFIAGFRITMLTCAAFAALAAVAAFFMVGGKGAADSK